jgi:hypothetical protein
VQKSFGPVHFNRVGVAYQDGKLMFLLDAALTAAGLTLSLDGLGFGSALNHFQPSFTLRGLGIQYTQGPLEIGGAFLHYPRTEGGVTYDEYDGGALIKTETLTLSAFGSYAYYQGHPSLFIYAVLDYPIGGPAFFFVTGLAAGFGYNRALNVPPVDKVAQFPLVTAAVAQSAPATPAPNGATSSPAGAGDLLSIVQQLGQLNAIPPTVGEIFLAIGIRFTSFKIIDSFALLTVAFGNEFEINLLGLSTRIAPTPEAGKEVPPLAEVQMAIKASFIPAQGFLGLSAQLTAASFVLSRDCHLTGGLAFYAWFAGDHAGDFVQTLGGYHPQFNRPSHYPVVPRLGINWQVSGELSIKGSAYFALTAALLMAGGSLQITWQSGNLRVWFNASADFLVGWKPFHYDAHVAVEIGVSYTLHFFGAHQITVDLGADVHLWGPELTGTAHIDLDIISFDVSFGSGSASRPQAIPCWDGGDTSFKKSFLPDNAVCSLTIAGGLLKAVQVPARTGGGQETVWLVNAEDLRLVSNSLIPSKEAYLGQKPLLLSGAWAADVRQQTPAATTSFGIAPMDLARGQLATVHTITVTRHESDSRPTEVPVSDEFHGEPVLKRVPGALWGESMGAELGRPAFIDNALTGWTITPAQLPKPGETAPVSRDAFQYSPESLAGAYAWQERVVRFTPANANDDKARRAALTAQLAAAPVQANRQGLLKALGLDAAGVRLNPGLASAFVIPPQVQL